MTLPAGSARSLRIRQAIVISLLFGGITSLGILIGDAVAREWMGG